MAGWAAVGWKRRKKRNEKRSATIDNNYCTVAKETEARVSTAETDKAGNASLLLDACA